MDIEILDVEVRDKSVSAKSLRRNGGIPAEYYGHGRENMSLKLDYQGFRKLYRRAGENTVVELHVGDDKKKINVLVHNIDLHPVTDEIIHVEFIHVNMDEEVHTHIPLEFTGTAPAVKELAGILTTHYNEVEVKCLPKDLVHSIEVDISGLNDFTDAIHFSDLNLPEGMTMLNDPEVTVATCVAPRIEKDPEPGEDGEGAEGEEGAESEGGEASAEGGEAKEEGGE